jgi:biotin carboxyl carrier protein
MKYIVTINDKNYEVEVEKGQANILNVTSAAAVPIQPTAAAVSTVPAEPVKATAVSAAHAQTISGEPIKAPMPGSIIDVKVHQGASVKKGDILVILEAMKMENEIVAPRDGIISQVIAAKGASVSTGDVLLALQ